MRPTEFDDIRPFDDEEVRPAMKSLLADRQFNAVLHGLAPWLPQWIRTALLKLSFTGVHSTLDFQVRYMKPMVRYVLHHCSTGATFQHDNIQPNDQRYTFLSNHRDIVLDSAILDFLLHENHFPTTCEIAIGDNLLIYPWIRTLVKLNKAFTVRRGLSPRELLESSQLMSRYIHYAITQKRENLWIAQREGRAKDSSDQTQESVLKMLAMAGEGSPAEQLAELNIVPLTISYEYDPCDYLKAQEFQQKRDDPSYRKSKRDDLQNMKTGIWGFKGHIYYQTGRCINEWAAGISADLPRNEMFSELALHIDREIHAGYHLFPGNYAAYDELLGEKRYADHYSLEEKESFEKYLEGQLAKITLPNPDYSFLRERLLTMYANPVINKYKALGESLD